MRFQIAQCFVEIGLTGGSHAIRILTKENLVQIQLKDLFLAQRLFDPGGKDDLLDLALCLPVTGQQKVLHDLLGDGRGPAHIAAPRAHRVISRSPDPAQIVPFVGIEILVLGTDKRLLDHVGDCIGRRKQAAFLRKLIDDLPLAGIDTADGGGLVLGQGFVAGQVPAIHPEDRPDGQRNHGDAHGDRCEDPAEEGQNKPEHDRPHLF
mmetsp:Transcript_27362/g.50217  ORF Transcript_27362/g.50217 Transcript_27362/m.50217 type:complete len:207 (+) Transcript_27362:201-821(+)